MRWDDETAFEVFVGETGTRLLRVAWALTGDRRRAEELVQRAYRRTSRRWHRVDDPILHALGVIVRGASRLSALTPRREAVVVLACLGELDGDQIARVLHRGRLEVQMHLAREGLSTDGTRLAASTRFIHGDPDTTWRAVVGSRRASWMLMRRGA